MDYKKEKEFLMESFNIRSRLPVPQGNKYMRHFGPRIKNKILDAKFIEIQAFAKDRGIDPSIIVPVVVQSMNKGDVVDMDMLPISRDDKFALSEFVKDTFLNVEQEESDEDSLVEEPISVSGVALSLGTQQKHDKFKDPEGPDDSSIINNLSNSKPAAMNRPHVTSGKNIKPNPLSFFRSVARKYSDWKARKWKGTH